MTVRVRNKGTGGGSAQITRFSDTFNRPDEVFLLGLNWNSMLTGFSQITGVQFAQVTNIVAGRGVFGDAGTNAANERAFYVPLPLSWQAVYGRQQFSQWQWTFYSGGGSVHRLGPAVFCTPNDENCYCAMMVPESNQIEVIRGVNTQTVMTALFSYVINDTVRIVCTPSPGSNFVELYINNVLQTSFTDNAGARPTTGMPGIAVTGTILGSVGANNFVCGIGTS